MARKQKGTEEKDYDILIGYVKSFDFQTEDGSTRLSGHPQVGRVYRLMKDPMGYRIHLGKDTNREGVDGLYLGELDVYNKEAGIIQGNHPRYSYTIEIVTPANYLQLDLEPEDCQKMAEWIESENEDLWAMLNKEQSGEAAVIRTGADLLKIIMDSHNAVPQQSASEDAERALEATLTLITHFQNKPVDQLLALYDGMYPRILNALKS